MVGCSDCRKRCVHPLAPSARGLRPQAVGERTVRLPEIFRAMARFSPSAPSGHRSPLWRKRHLPRIGGVCLAEGGFSTRWTAHFGGLFFALSNLHIKRMIRLSILPMPQAACVGKTTIHVVNPLFAVHCDIVQTTEKESLLRFLPLKTLKVRTLYESYPTSHRLDVPPFGRYRTRQNGDPAP